MSRLPPPYSVSVIDTAEWVDPDAVGGSGMLDRIPLVVDSLNAEEVRRAQQEEFPTLLQEACLPDSEYIVHEGLLYVIKHPTHASPWYP